MRLAVVLCSSLQRWPRCTVRQPAGDRAIRPRQLLRRRVPSTGSTAGTCRPAMVHRSRARERARLRALQRHDRRVLPAGNHGAGRRAVRLRQRRRSRRLSGAGQMLGTGTPLIPPPPGRSTDRLYRNDLEMQPDGTRALHFTDVTAASGIDAARLRHGRRRRRLSTTTAASTCISPDFGRNQMFRNNGNGTFTDVLEVRAGTDDPASWSVSAAFLDFDRDGLLDLFVGNYLDYTLEDQHALLRPVRRAGLLPAARCIRAQPNRLYRNIGDGTFTDVTIAAGVARAVRTGARRRRRRLQRRWVARSLRRPTTSRRISSGSTSTMARSSNTALLAGRGARRRGRAQGEHGRRRRRLRQRRRRGSVRDRLISQGSSTVRQ